MMTASTRSAFVLSAAILMGAGDALAQTIIQNPVETDPQWSWSVSAYGYLVPDSADYVQPTLMADRGRLHLEARANYEALDTGSAWLGYTLGGRSGLEWELMPMIGGVFGSTNGVAPGYRASVVWRVLELFSEGEVVVDASDVSGSFFYNWSEATIAPVEWFRLGLVTQRTRAYQSERDIQRGLLVGFSWRRVDVTGHVFNPGDDSPTVVIALRTAF